MTRFFEGREATFVRVAAVLVCAATLAVANRTGTADTGTLPREERTRRIGQLAAELQEGNPWPAIRQQRITTLLPRAMDAAGVGAWIVFCRENHNDPLARHIGGEHAGRLTGFLFLREGDGVKAVALAPQSEAITLKEVLPYMEVVSTPPETDVFQAVAQRIQQANPGAIAVNKSDLAAADGLTAMQYDRLAEALGPALAAKMTSSEELVIRWLGVKLPAEIDIMRKAAVLTDLLEYEAFDVIVPGRTTNGDLAKSLRTRVEQLRLGHAWSDNPGIQSGLDRGRGNDTRRVIIGGDIIDIDFGIEVHDTWCTDVQRFAYILKPGETAAPAQIMHAWKSAIESSRKMQAAMRPGVAGWEVDRIQVEWMEQQGSLKHWAGTGHAVGYWAHDVGPSISGYRKGESPRPGGGMRKLEPGMVFAFDGNFVWPAEDGNDKGTRSITSEEMAAVTANGSEYLTPVQNDLVLIPQGGLRGAVKSSQ